MAKKNGISSAFSRMLDKLALAGQPMPGPSDQGLTTEQLRREIELVQAGKPKLQPQLHRGIVQLDSIERKKAKLPQIQQRNPRATFLRQVGGTLEESEQTICSNLVRVLNRADLWDPLEVSLPEKKEIYRKHWNYIVKVLDRNDQILDACDELLLEAVQYVNGIKQGADQTAPLESMMQTIRQLSEEKGLTDD